MKYIIPTLLILFLFSQCQDESISDKPSASSNKNQSHVAVQENQLPTQQFTLSTSKDYSLITASGMIIQVPKGSLVSDQENITLEVKEALALSDMLRSGLQTTSNGELLSSGGMFKLSFASGQRVSIKQALRVFVPTQSLVAGMQKYQGVKDSSGQLNWINPQPLNPSPLERKIQQGEKLFAGNCSSCHATDMISSRTGPPLWHIEQRRSRAWLYDFTRNSARLISIGSQYHEGHLEYEHRDYYAECIFNQWNKTAMTAFPSMSDSALDAIYTYVSAQSDKYPNFKPSLCCDSCETYKRAVDREQTQLHALEREQQAVYSQRQKITLRKNILQVSMQNTTPVFSNKPLTNAPTANVNTVNAQPIMQPEPELSVGLFYDLDITSEGWYNIDILAKNVNGVSSQLQVRIKESSSYKVRLQLLVPEYKVSVYGSRLSGDVFQISYNNALYLPAKARCVLIAISEKEEKLYADTLQFLATSINTLDMALRETTADGLNAMVKALQLDQVKSAVKVNEKYQEYKQNAQQLEQLNKKIEDLNRDLANHKERIRSLEFLKPKQCDCDFERREEYSLDTSRSLPSVQIREKEYVQPE